MKRRKIAKALMTLGVVFIAFAVGLLCYNTYENKKAEDFSKAVMAVLMEMVEQKKLEDELRPDPFDDEMTEKEIDGYNYVGYLSIPALELDLPVMSTWDSKRLKIAPCRYYGSIKTDNLVIAAHNYRYHFGYLGHLKKDDVVMFTDMDGIDYTYRVQRVDQVLPTDVDKVKDTGFDLTLYTCTYGGARRIVVRCEKIKADKEKDRR